MSAGDGGTPPSGQGNVIGTTGTGASKSGAIGPAGGSLVLEGVTLTVPAGALDSEKTITITSSTGPGPEGAVRFSPVYTFEPSGLAFKSPVTVEIAYTGTLETAPKAAFFWSSSDGKTWDTILGASATTSSVKAPIDHFSGGFVGNGSVTFPSRGTSSGIDAGGGGNSCGAVFNDKCFKCQWEQCASSFATCFGPNGSKGQMSGDCKTYGECICNSKTLAESQSCSIATDNACLSCSESSGLSACAREKCVSACSGGG